MTPEGNDIFEPDYMVYQVKPYPIMKTLLDTLKLCLSHEKRIHDNHSKIEIETVPKVVQELIESIKQNLPRFGKNNWKITKMNALGKLFHYMLKLRNVKKIYSGKGEININKILKIQEKIHKEELNALFTKLQKSILKTSYMQ